MYGGGLITAALCSGGNANTNGDIIDKIIALPVRQGGTWGSVSDGYHYLLHYGNVGGGEVLGMGKFNTSASGNGEVVYAIGQKAKPAYFWFVLYKNIDNSANSVVFATALGNSVVPSPNTDTLGEYYDYSTRANGDIIEWYLYRYTKRSIAGVENAVITPRANRSEFEISFKVHYTDVNTYYNWETGDIDKQESRTGEFTTSSTGYFVIPSAIPSAAFYTNLSAAEYEQEMVNLVTILDQIIE